MVSFSKDVAFKAWSNLEDGVSPEQIALILPLEKRTVERLRTVLNGLKKGMTNKELVTPEWKEDTIIGLREWWEDYLRSKHAWSRQKHLGNMSEAARKLRSRIINPELRRRPFTQEKSTWFWSGFDWRLAPDYWFSIVVPLLDFVNVWIPDAESLLSHISDSNFMKHYKKLEEGTRELQVKLNEVTNTLKSEDSFYADKLKEFDEILGVYFVDNFVPDSFPSKETIDALIADLSGLEDFTADTIRKLEKSYVELDEHCNQLDNLLQQVYDDLNPDIIDLEIETGKCSRCT